MPDPEDSQEIDLEQLAEQRKEKLKKNMARFHNRTKYLEHRRQLVLSLRAQGGTFRQIATRLREESWAPPSYSKQSAFTDFKAALKTYEEHCEDMAHQLRLLQTYQYNELLAAYYPMAKNRDILSLDRVLGIMDRLAQLWGTDLLGKAEQDPTIQLKLQMQQNFLLQSQSDDDDDEEETTGVRVVIPDNYRIRLPEMSEDLRRRYLGRLYREPGETIDHPFSQHDPSNPIIDLGPQEYGHNGRNENGGDGATEPPQEKED